MGINSAKNTPNIGKFSKGCKPAKNADTHIEELTKVLDTLFQDLDLNQHTELDREAHDGGTDEKKKKKRKGTKKKKKAKALEGGKAVAVENVVDCFADDQGVGTNDGDTDDAPSKKKKKNRKRGGQKKKKAPVDTFDSIVESASAKFVSLTESKRRQVEHDLDEEINKNRIKTAVLDPNRPWDVDYEIGATKSILDLSIAEKKKLKSILREITVDNRLEARKKSVMASRMRTAVEIEIEKLQEGHECSALDGFGCNAKVIEGMWRKRDQLLELYTVLAVEREKDRFAIRTFAERELVYIDQTILACKRRIEEKTEISKMRLAQAIADANSCLRSLMAGQGHGN
ncbi:hypothetical protein BJ508DRAFT_330807 [Ascobolus immersus RN42]|uniref:Uncharacterized protein n=1 Tax=Ascobolus immersus RN42 TaxID=1160509 RepID=A0A3N4HUK0_ASCIM|nr:hypothetical protein BJ508DRAFT_330807 [Ascobolus immersus RN42]